MLLIAMDVDNRRLKMTSCRSLHEYYCCNFKMPDVTAIRDSRITSAKKEKYVTEYNCNTELDVLS